MEYPRPIAMLIDSFMKLPGVGQKTATRMAFHIMDMPQEDVEQFSQSLLRVQTDLHFCEICGNITEGSKCEICLDSTRDQSTILVVENIQDIMAMEKMKEYHGLYHVLHGVLSPMEGTGVEDINLASLVKRLQGNTQVKEVIVATNANTEGEATAMYIARLLKPAGIKVTRLAYGLAMGSDIEYTDEMTLFKAVEGRKEI